MVSGIEVLFLSTREFTFDGGIYWALPSTNIMLVSLPQQLLALASTFHKASILLFGYFVPALSSVKGM